MAPVRLAVQTAGGNPGVQICRVARADLQDVRDVEPQQELLPLVPREAKIADAPQLLPSRPMPAERLRERWRALRGLAGACERVADRTIARGEEGRHLLDANGFTLANVEGQRLLDVVVHLVQRALDIDRFAAFVDTCARALAYVDVGLPGSYLQRDDLWPECPWREGIHMPPHQPAVPGDAAVGHTAVDRGDQLHAAGPVLGRKRPLDAGLVRVGHADKATACQRSQAAVAVAEPQLAKDDRVADIKRVAVGE